MEKVRLLAIRQISVLERKSVKIAETGNQTIEKW